MDGPLSRAYPVLATSTFGAMTTPALVVAGDGDIAPAFSSHADWRSDAYRASPGRKSLLTLLGAEHMLGGVSGYDAGETSDENPERVAALRSMVWAFLRTALHPGNTAWVDARAALEASPTPLGRVESR